MGLKLMFVFFFGDGMRGLNQTYNGIETVLLHSWILCSPCLNQTYNGIETEPGMASVIAVIV